MADQNKPDGDAAADDERSALSTVASTIADAATAGVSAVGQIAGGARRLINERPGARVRRVRQMGKEPLANLWELHPDARSATFRELAPRVVPVDQIAGTAVEGPVQRGGDFLPVRDRRGADWRARWQRILTGLEELAILPPVDLVKFGEEYWVIDGHNRVAAALYNGQYDIDANVVEARMPGVPADRDNPEIAPYLAADSLELREAGSGRSVRSSHTHDHVEPDANAPDPLRK
jgi:hypothetical protein